MDTETLDVDGVTFVSCWALCYGDYDNSTDLERANVRWLREQHRDKCVQIGMSRVLRSNVGGLSAECTLSSMEWEDYIIGKGWFTNEARREDIKQAEVLVAHGSYGSAQLWIRQDVDDEHGYLTDLAHYPELDSDTTYAIRDELIAEAWDCWAEHDLRKALDALGVPTGEISSGELGCLFDEALCTVGYGWFIEGGGNACISNREFDDAVARVAETIKEQRA